MNRSVVGMPISCLYFLSHVHLNKQLTDKLLQQNFRYSLPGITLFYITKNFVHPSSKIFAVRYTQSYRSADNSQFFVSVISASKLMHDYVSNS